MIKLVIVDISSLAFSVGEDKISEKIEASEYLSDLLERTRHPMLAIERTSAYLSLFSFFRHLFGEEMPPLVRDENGRPYIDGSSYDFNISHSANMVAVAISDDVRVGVDVEEEISPDRAEHIETRYTSRMRPEALDGKLPTEIEIYIATLSPDGELTDYRMLEVVTFTEDGEENIGKNATNVKSGIHFDAILPTESTTSKWSVAEAALKCEGGGFADFFDHGAKFPDGITAKAYRITLAAKTRIKTFYLAIAAKKR
jgi:phosphopantetheinyl transferase